MRLYYKIYKYKCVYWGLRESGGGIVNSVGDSIFFDLVNEYKRFNVRMRGEYLFVKFIISYVFCMFFMV